MTFPNWKFNFNRKSSYTHILLSYTLILCTLYSVLYISYKMSILDIYKQYTSMKYIYSILYKQYMYIIYDTLYIELSILRYHFYTDNLFYLNYIAHKCKQTNCISCYMICHTVCSIYFTNTVLYNCSLNNQKSYINFSSVTNFSLLFSFNMKYFRR